VEAVDRVPVPEESKKLLLWSFYASYLPTDVDSLQREFVRHAEFTLATTRAELTPYSSF
jgi:hypothetical protein